MAGSGSAHLDQLSIDIPELVTLQLTSAGLGSRALALCIDYLLQGMAFLLVTACLVLANVKLLGGRAGVWVEAAWILVLFLLQWGYFALFEAFWNGKTPGKRALRLRVIEINGRAVTMGAALLRNLLRAVDFLPFFYAAGAVSIFVTHRQQRLGDLAAGTLVVHERPLPSANSSEHHLALWTPVTPVPRAVVPTGVPADRLARLTAGDLLLLESFAARRLELPLVTGEALARKLTLQMTSKMDAPAPEGVSASTFLERLAEEVRSTRSVI